MKISQSKMSKTFLSNAALNHDKLSKTFLSLYNV